MVELKHEEYDYAPMLRGWQGEAVDAPAVAYDIDGRCTPLRGTRNDASARNRDVQGANGMFGADNLQDERRSRILAPRPLRRPSSVPSVPFPASAHRYHGPVATFPPYSDPVPHRSSHLAAPYPHRHLPPDLPQLRGLHAPQQVPAPQQQQQHTYAAQQGLPSGVQHTLHAPPHQYSESVPPYADAYGASSASLMIDPQAFPLGWESGGAPSSFTALTPSNAMAHTTTASSGGTLSHVTSSGHVLAQAPSSMPMDTTSTEGGFAGYDYPPQNTGTVYADGFGWYADASYSSGLVYPQQS